MTESEKLKCLAALRVLLDKIEETPSGDGPEMLRLAALVAFQLNRLTAEHK